jgi:ATP-binding cassette subfamily B protein
MISSLLRFRRFLTKYWGTLALGTILTLASALFALAQPWPLKVIIDSVLRGKPIHLPGTALLTGRSKGVILDVAVAAYLMIIAIGALFDYVGSLLMDSTGERLVTDIRGAVFARLQRLSLRFHSSQRAGDLVSRVMSDIDRVDDMLVQSFSVLLPNVALLAGMFTVMFLVDVPLTLAALAVSPLLFLSMFRYTARIKGASRRARKKEGLLAARTSEVLGAIRVVQAFTGEEREDERFSEESSETLVANLEAVRLQSQFSPLIDVLAGLGVGLVLFIGTHQVLSGKLSLGVLLVFLSYVASFYRPMRQLSKLSIVTSRGVASAERVSEVLEAEIDVRDLPGAQPIQRAAGRVEFSAVHLSYGDTPALHDISLVVEPGEVVALVGPTGAGKTSLVSLIPRFLDPDAGRVLIDGDDVRSIQLQSLRSNIALVLQEPILFEGTIFDNIAYGNPEASEDAVVRAAETALVGGIVGALPEGYGTRVGERGATLSGGERQRISIARALVRDAPILILDEPTSGLDPQSEVLLMEAMERLMAARTTFVIAHRMSTVRRADRVVVLDHGRIVEQGTHEELIGLPAGMYRSFLDLQVGDRDGVHPRPPRPGIVATPDWRKDDPLDSAPDTSAQGEFPRSPASPSLPPTDTGRPARSRVDPFNGEPREHRDERTLASPLELFRAADRDPAAPGPKPAEPPHPAGPTPNERRSDASWQAPNLIAPPPPAPPVAVPDDPRAKPAAVTVLASELEPEYAQPPLVDASTPQGSEIPDAWSAHSSKLPSGGRSFKRIVVAILLGRRAGRGGTRVPVQPGQRRRGVAGHELRTGRDLAGPDARVDGHVPVERRADFPDQGRHRDDPSP